MRRSEARIALEAARRWEAEGRFRPGAFEDLERRLRPDAEQTSLGLQALYAIGGVLLGAATAALFGLLQLNDVIGDAEGTAWLFFFACAILLLGVGFGTHLARATELGDALLLAGLVPTAILLGPEPPLGAPMAGLVVVAAAGVLAFRHRAYLLPLVSLALGSVAIPATLFRMFDYSGGPAIWYWLFAAAAVWAGMMVWNRLAPPSWDDEGAAVATIALGAAWVVFVVDILEPTWDGGHEVFIAMALGLLIGASVLLRAPGVAFTAGLGLTIDAIMFAFSFGGPTVGLVTLLLLAGALIAAATMLRRRRAETSSTPD